MRFRAADHDRRSARCHAGGPAGPTTRGSPARTTTTPPRISAPPSSWITDGLSASNTHAKTSAASTSPSATNDASRELGGADLTGVLFCVQAQLDAARGDAATVLPAALRRPTHWAG